MTVASYILFQQLVGAAKDGARLVDSMDHGDVHWRQVADVGLILANEDARINPGAVLLFALFHDCRRENEHHDPFHGHRGAMALGAATDHWGGDGVGKSIALAFTACWIHHGGHVEEFSPTIGACLDADRLLLPRVGIKRDPAYFSLKASRLMIEDGWHHTREIPTWETLREEFDQLDWHRRSTSKERT